MPDHTDQEMSTRAMVLLGGGGSLAVAAVLGLSLLFGVGGAATRAAPSAPAVATAVPASGVAAVTVPTLAGVDSMTATTRLADLRLSVAAVIRVPSALTRGQVVRTYPAEGASVAAGGQVTLYVSGTTTGRRVAVPYLVGMNAEQARSAAAQSGLRLVVLRGTTTVSVQTPRPGAIVSRGSVVFVSLG